MKRKIRVTRNKRGFAVGEFTDRYDNQCSIQKSSLATEDCIWLGIDNPAPMVMASQAASVGVVTDKTTGWVPYPIPDNVSITTRMHLTRNQVKALLPLLERFVETGELMDK